MQKLILTVAVSTLLCACTCKCTPKTENTNTLATLTATQDEPQSSPETLTKQEEQNRPANLQNAPAVSPLSPANTAVVTAPSAFPAGTPAAPAQDSTSPAFGPQQAAALIAQQRAAQTLSAPPADSPAFKKEEILPTDGRLLSPLAYEPISPDTTHAPWSNESLKYGLYYSFIKAGTAYIKTRGITNYNGKQAYLIQTTAFSASAIDSVFKVRDVNYSWLDVNTLHSLGYSQSVREGNYKRDEWVTFDHENGRFYGEIQKKKEPRVIAGELDQQVLDMLTSLYYVRSQPLEVGKDVTFDIINREERYPLVVKVLGKETVKTKAGKFNCWLVEPQFRGEGIFVAKGKSLKVWLTDDKYRMPVKMSVEVFIGSVYAELLDYQRN